MTSTPTTELSKGENRMYIEIVNYIDAHLRSKNSFKQEVRKQVISNMHNEIIPIARELNNDIQTFSTLMTERMIHESVTELVQNYSKYR